jgi:hypothetical protein
MELPPGFRFHPTDEELITHYLARKVADTRFAALAVGEADLNKSEPWDLPCKLPDLPPSTTAPPYAQRPRANNCVVVVEQRWRRWGRRSGTSSASRTASTRRG